MKKAAALGITIMFLAVSLCPPRVDAASGIPVANCQFISAQGAKIVLLPARDKSGKCNHWYNFPECQEVYNLLIDRAQIQYNNANYTMDILAINFAKKDDAAQQAAFWDAFFKNQFPLDYALPAPTNVGYGRNTLTGGKATYVKALLLSDSKTFADNLIDISFFTQADQDRGHLALLATALGMQLRVIHDRGSFVLTQTETFEFVGFNMP